MFEMSRSGWPENSADSLWEICLGYCASNLERTVCDYDKTRDSYELKPHVTLSQTLSDEILRAVVDLGVPFNRKTLNIFHDTTRTSLKHGNLDGIDLTDDDVETILRHQPVELNVSSADLTSRTVRTINHYGQNLVSLQLGHSTDIFRCIGVDEDEKMDDDSDEIGRRFGMDFVFRCPQLRSFGVKSQPSDAATAINLALSGMTRLTRLDLSNCDIEVDAMSGLRCLPSLQMLNLHNVPIDDLASAFCVITQIKSLRYVGGFVVIVKA